MSRQPASPFLLWPLLVLVTAACAHRPEPLGFNDFLDQVLMPLSVQRAGELVQQQQAKILAEAALRLSLSSAAGPSGKRLGWTMGTFHAGSADADAERQLAELEAKRLPLQHALLRSYRERARMAGGLYRVCVDGAERRYEPAGDRFVRVDNGTGPCPTQIVDLSALR